MGVEARCCPWCHSAAHCRHMKRQPFLCNGCPCRGCHHCDCHCHLCCHCYCPLPSPLPFSLPLQSPLTIATAISVAPPSVIAVAIAVALAVGHCRLRHCRPSQLPSPLDITLAIAIGHFRELLPWRGKNCIQTISAKNAYHILFCLDSGRGTDQSRMTDQVSSGDDQH